MSQKMNDLFRSVASPRQHSVMAKEHDVPLYENPPLARALYRSVEPDQIVPIEFFGAVAEILAYVYKQDEKAKGH